MPAQKDQLVSSGQPSVGLFYTPISGKVRSDRALLKSALDMIGEISVTSQFKVSLHLSPNGISDLESWLAKDGLLDNSDKVTSYDFMCSDTSLPGAAFNTFDEIGSRQGVKETFPARREFPPFSMEFYVDSEYRMIRLFEEWMNFINPIYTSAGEATPNSIGSGYGGAKNRSDFFRLRYPNEYKRIISVTKFERDFFIDKSKSLGILGTGANRQTSITYRMIDAFPSNIASIPVTYQGSIVTKSIIEFKYSRYVIERNRRELPP